jgi:pSer/pThr/pTyr-binding forkhead associated (FHA) protein
MINECPQCNFPVPRESSRFCNQCGADLQAFDLSKPNLQLESPPSSPPKDSLSKNMLEATALKTMTTPQKETQSIEATLHILSREGLVTERGLAGAETRIGKGPQNEIVLTDASVSSTHAMISFADGAFTLSDLGSRNGTFVNEVRVTESRKLQHGDLIKMGHCAITFRVKEAETTQSIPRTVLLDNAPPPPPLAPPTPKTPPMTEASLAQALVSAGLVAQTEISRLQGVGAPGKKSRRLFQALTEEKLVSEIGLRDLIGRTFNLVPIDMKTMEVDAVTAAKLRVDFLRSRSVCPVIGQQPDKLMLAIADPTDKATIDEVERVTGKKASLRLALPSEITAQIDNHFTPRLIGVMPTGEKIEALLNQPEIEIGKAPHNKLVVNDPTVSSTHAIVVVRDGGYTIVDLGSSNGTFINGNRQGGDAYTLQHGDKIQLGNVMLTFRNPAETTENKTARLSLEALEDVRRRAALKSGPVASAPSTNPSSWSVPPSKVVTAAEDDEVEKSEKKKKKKDKDKGGFFSANAMSRIIAQVLGGVVGIVGSVIVAKYALMPSKEDKVINDIKTSVTKVVSSDSWSSLPGKAIEASGVAHVPGSDLVLMVDDGQPGAVLAMKLNAAGEPVGAPKAIPLGVTIKNPEAITNDGAHFYIVGSLSDAAWGGDNAIVRFAFDPQTETLRGQAEVINDFRGLLLSKVPELKSQGEIPSAQGGLNVEGLAWDKLRDRLVVGLRSLVGAQAVLVPLRLKDPRGVFNADNLMVENPRVIFLQLGGQGVRDITYDAHLKSFLIISGAPEGVEKAEFKLWEWDGEALSTKVREQATLSPKYKPEGITAAIINGRPLLFLVGDASSYLKLDYLDVK